MLSLLAIFGGLILCGVGFAYKERTSRIIFWLVGIALLAYGLVTFTHGGVHFT